MTATVGGRWRREVPPRRPAYDEIVVLGAHATAMWRRLALLDRHPVRAEVVTLLVAPRPTAGEHPRRADGTNAELLGPGGRFPAHVTWRSPLAATRGPEGAPLAGLLPTEAHLALVLAGRRWGLDVADVLARLDAADPTVTVGLEVGSAPAATRLVLLRTGSAVPPTTAGTLRDWAAGRDRPDAAGVLVVTSHPHLLRTRGIVAAVAGPGVEVAAASGPDRMPLRTLAGEAVSLARAVAGARDRR